MDVIREDTVAALHRAMLVLREELEMKNRTITRLRRRKHKRNSGNSGNPAKSVRGFSSIEDLPKPVKTCLKSAGRSLELRQERDTPAAMYNEDEDGEDSSSEEQISRSFDNDNGEEISRLAGEIIEDLLEKIFPNNNCSEEEELGFSDNFLDVYKFSGTQDIEEDLDTDTTESSECQEILERNFTNIFQTCDENFSSEESETDSTESSDSERGRVYKVNDETDESDGDCFYSSEDLILNFVREEEEEEAARDNKYNIEEESESLVSLEIQDKDQLQVEKHVLKFELSKQLFEGTEESQRESSDVLKERKRKLNEEVFANLFDYDRHQVENIKLGPSLASRTLAESDLLKLEKNLCIKRRRPFCYEDIFTTRRSGSVLSRSQSQPNIDSITEEDPRSSSSSEPTTVRPILKKAVAGLVLSSSGSQTDITALRCGSRSDSSLHSRSSSVTFLLPSPSNRNNKVESQLNMDSHNSPIKPFSPASTPEKMLSDISFLSNFKEKVLSQTSSQITGRYSLIDENMKTVEAPDHVITELWKVPANKSLSCLLGDMESCETEEIIIGEEENGNMTSLPPLDKKTADLTSTDYRDHLIGDPGNCLSSDYDTDDLIEDARNFVLAAQEKFVDVDGWVEIDNKRRQTRLSRRARTEKVSRKVAKEENVDVGLPGTKYFVPRTLSDLKLGLRVKTISCVGSKVCQGVIR